MESDKTEELDFLMEIEFRLQQDLNSVQRRIGILLLDKEAELEDEVYALRRARFTVIHNPDFDGA